MNQFMLLREARGITQYADTLERKAELLDQHGDLTLARDFRHTARHVRTLGNTLMNHAGHAHE